MSFGFPPKYKQNYPINNIEQNHFIVSLLEAIEKFTWNVSYMSNNIIVAYTNNGMFKDNAEISIIINGSISTIQSKSTSEQLYDWGKNKKNVDQLIAEINETLSNAVAVEMDAKYQTLKNSLFSVEQDVQLLESKTTIGKFRSFVSIFVPSRGYNVTQILIDINLLLFISMIATGVNIMLPDNISLLSWGANYKPMTLDGQAWRVFTSTFLHIGVIHLIMNMYALLYIGMLLEPRLGTARFASAYIFTGIVASLTSLAWHDIAVSAGASGAIFGMYGVFLAMLTTNLIEKNERKAMLTSILVFVGYNLLNGVKAGIDNAAHIGGLVSGMMVGYAYVPGLKKPASNMLGFGPFGALTILLIAAGIMEFKTLPNDFGKYDKKMEQFFANEKKALHVFEVFENSSKEEILSELSTGNKLWQENIKILDETDNYKLTADLYVRNINLKKYCELRVRVYDLLYNEVSLDTNLYTVEIDSYTSQINKIIEDFSENK